MANIKSQIKRNRQNETARVRNKAVRSALKTHLKKFSVAVQGGDATEAAEAFKVAARQLDKAAQKGIVHGNYAANHKAKMSKKLTSLSA